MGYRVEVPEPVEEQIIQWDLNGETLAALRAHLAKLLGTRSVLEMGGVSITAPIRCFKVAFPLTDPVTGQRYEFVFWVNETERPGTRILLEGQIRHSCCGQ